MGELISGTVAQVAGGVALTAGSRGLRWLRLAGRFEASWLHLADDLAERSLTAPQIADVESFLRSPSVRPILSLLAVSLLGPPESDTDKTLGVVKTSFVKAAEKWNIDSPEKWLRAAPLVWARIVSLLEDGLSAVNDEKVADEASQFSRFVATPLRVRRKGNELTAYVSRIAALASDIEQLAELEELYVALLERVDNRQPPPILTHTDVDTAADFARLYIPRVVYREDGGEESSETLMANGSPYRVVLTGAPGAGKTTFVSHLVYGLSHGEEIPRITLAIRCRDYLREGWSSSLTEYLAKMLHRVFDMHESAAALRGLLLLGRIELIVDGLDEIANISTRVEMVERIEGLCRAYPSTSILVTSREIGYQRAALDKRIFQHYKLKEFTEAQVADYAARWFSLVERPELTEPFIVESQTVTDLRSNPLLLSLLCILYRARGSIPRKRRDIYGKCAELLFIRWDAHRGISQTEDMPAYGQRLMQEIARWVYKSKAAQAGLEEKVIVKAIGRYLADIAGIDELEAKTRAADFLEFCAGRAWLLAKIGTSEHGERIFGFSHRTFLEYFTAESLCRAATNAKAVAKDITAAFRADPTSVLPELMIQAYDDKEDGGGWRVFEEVCERSENSALPIRLIDGTLLPQRSRERAFNMLCDDWSSRRRISLETFVALLNLNPDARSHFTSEYLVDNRVAQRMFIDGWATLELTDQAGWFRDEWGSQARRMQEVAASTASSFGPESTALSWLALSGQVNEPARFTPSGLIVAKGQFGICLGAVWWTIEHHLLGAPTTDTQLNLLQRWIQAVAAGNAVDILSEGVFRRLLTDRLDRVGPHDGVWTCESSVVREALLASLLICSETVLPPASLGPIVSACYGFDVGQLVLRRRAPRRKRNLKDLDESIPGWVKSWCLEKISLVYTGRGPVWDPARGGWVADEGLQKPSSHAGGPEDLDEWEESNLTESDMDRLADRAARDLDPRAEGDAEEYLQSEIDNAGLPDDDAAEG
ncbi:NACHT domain-containing protein [Kribbella sp. NPDC049227]|uniref:NACHT domain-containing protein n=1 Tax=Kribbella sp. NPDC049227 TaxID=3364113 RepID=UPI00371A5C9D